MSSLILPPHHLPASSSSNTSNYGRACTNCSKAKCKCSFIEGQQTCERCDRLKKNCQPLIPARKRTARPTNASSTAAKQQRLEQKLDSLVSLLQAQGNAVEPVSNAVQPEDLPSTGWPSLIPNDGSTPSGSTVSAPTVSTAPTSPHQSDISFLSSTYAESQETLEKFRDESLTFFPFMYLPLHMTVLQLSRDFPTLWLSISATSAKSMTQLLSVSKKLQNTILEAIYERGERSLDLLLATLSYIGWFRHQRHQKPFFNMWTQMAASLAVELGLNKAVPGEPAIFCYLGIWPSNRQVTAKRERTMVERRAMLSTFLMTSWVTSSFRKSDTLKWTPHMDECLRTLEQQPEWEGDRMLALQVRCQLIQEQVYETPWSSAMSNDRTKQSAPDYFTKSLNIQLQEVRTNLGTLSSEKNDVIRLFVLSTELTINEASQELPLPLDEKGIVDHRKLEPFYNALYGIKAWLDIFFKMPYISCSNVTFSLFSKFVQCLVSLFRLSTLEDPSWDRDLVKQTVDIVKVVDRFAANIERLRDTRALIIDNDLDDMFTKSAMMMRKLGDAWAAEIAAIGVKQKEQPAGEMEISSEFLDLDMLDSEWITDMFLAWEH